ncbi:MAG: prolyl oligopeptidase family serine peptidase [Pseudomonadota bacterium]
MSEIANIFAIRAALKLALLIGAIVPLSHARAAGLQAQLQTEQQQPRATTLPRSAFLQRASIVSVVLSPDGRQVAWLSEADRNREVWLQATGGGKARRLMAHTPAQQLAWTRDSRWLLLESAQHLFALAVDGQSGSGIVTTLGGRSKRAMMRVDDAMPAAAIVIEQEGMTPQGQPALWRLLRVDMRGKRTRLHEDSRRITGYALDPQGRLAFVQRVEGLELTIQRVEAGGRLREVARCARMRRCTPLVASADGRDLILRGNFGEASGPELHRLMRLDADGRPHVLHADPRGEADLDTLTFDPLTRQPLIAAYRSTVAANHGLDADTQRHLRRLEGLLPQRDQQLDQRIDIGRGQDARWLIETRAGHQQGSRWHLYDPAAGTVSVLFDDRPRDARSQRPVERIDEATLARKIPLVWRASDGMRLHGFVYLPPGRAAATLPLVVVPHGGPWNHWRPEYNGISQFLVNRGYAVFEPNFRSSTGHGRVYTFAANGDFGNGRVQQDIVDGTRFVLASGIGDAQRVGIVGASFGGYSTLLGVTFQPELFKVGVAFVPPPDFAWTLRWLLRNPESLEFGNVVPMTDWLRILSLDVDDRTHMATLHAQSPLANAARMNRPLLLVAGGEDRRVGIAGVIEYAARLKLANKDVSLLVDTDAGHANREPIAREANLYLLEAMLHRHLGGTAPAAPDAALQRYLMDNLRLCHRDLQAVCAKDRVADAR